MGNLLTILDDTSPSIYIKYNWRRDLPDKRDIYIKFENTDESILSENGETATPQNIETLESYDIPHIDLRKKFPPV